MSQFVPPSRVFQIKPGSSVSRHQASGYSIPNFVGLVRTNTGGMAQVFTGHPFPRKGFPYIEGIMALSKAKRVTLSLFHPYAALKNGLRAFLEAYVLNWIRLVDAILSDNERIPYLKYEYYCEFAKGLWHAIYLFLRYLGFSFDTSYRAGLVVATFFEYDDAYRFPPQDVLSETTLEALLKHPRREINRLAKLFWERTMHKGQDGAGARMIAMAQMFSLLLLLPPVKKAFRFALSNIDFSYLQYDNIDRYWALNRSDYMSMGRPLEERMEEQISLMVDFMQQQNPGKRIAVERNDDGTVNLNAYDDTREDNPVA